MSETLRRGVAGLTTVLAIDFLGASAPAASMDQVLAPPAVVQEEQPPLDPRMERYNQYLEGPKFPCMENYEPTVREALACKAVQQHTRIALVNFDYTPAEAQVIADSMVEPFDRSTNGVFHAEPVVIPATDAARKEAEARNPGCVDEFMDFASIAAQAAMPKELDGDNIDMVIALTKAQACDPAEAGVSEGGRYADLLMAGHEDLTLKQVGLAAAHEAGHGVGLGHAGDMVCNNTVYLEIPQAPTLDLDAYLQTNNCKTYEYGSLSMSAMGNPFFIDQSRFRPALPQIPQLMWAQEKLGESPELAVEATPQGVTLNYDEAAAGKFITIPVSADNPTQPVRDLSIVPEVDLADYPDASYGPNIWNSTLYLHNSDNSVVNLGYAGGVAPGGTRSRVITYQGKQITITLSDGALTVTSS